MVCVLGTYVLAIAMANSPNAVLRAMAPVAVLDNWAPLLTFIRLVRSAGAGGILDRARDQIEGALRDVLADCAVSVAPGKPPSLFYSTLAASIVGEAGLADRFPFERMIDRLGAMLAAQMSGENVNLVADARLLRSHGRRIPDVAIIGRFVQRFTLMSKPVGHQSLVELCELADLLGDRKERERLAPIVRSDVGDPATQPEERSTGSPRLLSRRCAHRRARVYGSQRGRRKIAELAVRTADELTLA